MMLAPPLVEDYPMAWTTLDYSRRKVDWAGKVLINRPDGGHRSFKDFQEVLDWSEALDVINNFRSTHGYPLHATTMTLRQRVPKVDNRAVVVSRLKRLVSIEAKLDRFSWLKLSRMQDIGGCRAVVANVKKVEELDDLYASGRTSAKLRRIDNYIENPKADGYRGIHYVYGYEATSVKNEAYNGFLIEVQLRSALQHIWATANETVSMFTGQRLKAGTGKDEWLRFFALMASSIAGRERRLLVPGVPEDEDELRRELRALADELNVTFMLRGWQMAMNIMEEAPRHAKVFLLILDTKESTLQAIPFTAERVALASSQYLEVEKKIEKTPTIDAVLAKADSIAALRKAYPNYYADVDEFLKAMNSALAVKAVTK